MTQPLAKSSVLSKITLVSISNSNIDGKKSFLNFSMLTASNLQFRLSIQLRNFLFPSFLSFRNETMRNASSELWMLWNILKSSIWANRDFNNWSTSWSTIPTRIWFKNLTNLLFDCLMTLVAVEKRLVAKRQLHYFAFVQ